MADFHIGDRVRTIEPGRGAAFVITELRDDEGAISATGDGHCWWPVSSLDYDLTAEQKAAAELYESEVAEFIRAMRRISEAEKLAAQALPGWYIKRIRDAGSGL